MKISYRILIANFAIVGLILVSSAIAFYSLIYNVLASQQSKILLHSVSNFSSSYRQAMQETEDDFLYLFNNKKDYVFSNSNLSERSIDFIFKADEKSPNSLSIISSKNIVYVPDKKLTLKEFLEYNPQAVIKIYHTQQGELYYYGRIITGEFLSEFSKKIGSEIAIIWNNSTAELSNPLVNEKYLFLLNEIYEKLSTKKTYEVYINENNTADIIAALAKPSGNFEYSNNLKFLIYSTLTEISELRSSLLYILIIVGIAGIILSLILTFLFTDKIRKHIRELSNATEITKEGNFKNKITFQSKDELGDLAGAFNSMIDELDKKQKMEKDYSDFITLINQNPTLKEISEAALTKIIKACNFIIGSLYHVEEEGITLGSCYGWKADSPFDKQNEFFNTVLKTKETLEINIEHEFPIISTGIVDVEIKNILILPVLYNNKIISILVLGSVKKASHQAKDYLEKINPQLAIGLTNASALVQLENFVSELKRLNEDYLQQNDQIKKQNVSLVELHNKLQEKADELEIQKLKAEDATTLKSQFLANMSHELRTPMNSILGLTKVIIDDSSINKHNKERLEVIYNSGKRLMNLINEILDLSKIESGRMEINEDEVPINELINEIEAFVYPLINTKKLNYKTNCLIDRNTVVKSDRVKVSQVIMNLLSNAIKFTNEGLIELEISAEEEDLIFKIKDTGIGISEENQKIIFEEFRQIDGTNTRKYGGTGLGLSISQKISTLLNGRLELASEPGNGSTFVFTIPFNFIQVRTSNQNKAANNSILPTQINKTILVIEDLPSVKHTIGQYLNSKGYDTEFADDGKTGIEKAIQLNPFAITLNVMMQNKNGWNILKELKENEKTKNIPVIPISILGDKNLGYGLNAYEYMIKPFSIDTLNIILDQLKNNSKRKVEKIVLVDDDELEFEKFKAEFNNENIKIHYIKDSEIAFSKILEIQPDLIIIDLIMPNVDGITLSHKLKTNRETKHIPIIISTAKDLTREEVNSLQNIVEEITIKSNGHPLDVLKVVRDRIRFQEAKIIDEDNELEIGDEFSLTEDDSLMQYDSSNEILVVDDDPDSLFMLNELLKSQNYKTRLVKNGLECLEYLEKRIPSLILLDIMMPEMDGFQTIQRIKENKKWSNIPVFAVTAKAMVNDKVVIYKHGFDDYITKPVEQSILLTKIEEIYNKLKPV